MSRRALPQLTRRNLLRLGLIGGIGLGLGRLGTNPGALRYAPDIARAQLLATLGGMADVAIVRCPSYAEARAAIEQALGLVGAPVIDGKRVVLKPNLVDSAPGRPIHTHPDFLGALIDYFVSHGAAEVLVADGPSFNRDTEQVLEESGLGEMLRRHNTQFIDLNYDDLEEVTLRGGYGPVKSLLLPKTITRADLLVSVPKLKTHHWTGVSVSMKNLFGVVPGIKYGWPKNTLHTNGITASIVDLYATLRPGLAVVDGVVGLEGDGPVNGTARASGVVLAGRELVALDATAARVMGIDPETVDHLRAARQLGLGRTSESAIRVLGAALREVAGTFELPPALGEGAGGGQPGTTLLYALVLSSYCRGIVT